MPKHEAERCVNSLSRRYDVYALLAIICLLVGIFVIGIIHCKEASLFKIESPAKYNLAEYSKPVFVFYKTYDVVRGQGMKMLGVLGHEVTNMKFLPNYSEMACVGFSWLNPNTHIDGIVGRDTLERAFHREHLDSRSHAVALEYLSGCPPSIGNIKVGIPQRFGIAMDARNIDHQIANLKSRSLSQDQRFFHDIGLFGDGAKSADSDHDANYPCYEQSDARQILRRKQTREIAFRVIFGPVALLVGCLLIYHIDSRRKGDWRLVRIFGLYIGGPLLVAAGLGFFSCPHAGRISANSIKATTFISPPPNSLT